MVLKSRTVIRAPGGRAERERSSSEPDKGGWKRQAESAEANHRETAEITVLHQIWYLEGYLEVRIEQSFGSSYFWIMRLSSRDL